MWLIVKFKKKGTDTLNLDHVEYFVLCQWTQLGWLGEERPRCIVLKKSEELYLPIKCFLCILLPTVSGFSEGVLWEAVDTENQMARRKLYLNFSGFKSRILKVASNLLWTCGRKHSVSHKRDHIIRWLTFAVIWGKSCWSRSLMSAISICFFISYNTQLENMASIGRLWGRSHWNMPKITQPYLPDHTLCFLLLTLKQSILQANFQTEKRQTTCSKMLHTVHPHLKRAMGRQTNQDKDNTGSIKNCY